MPLASEAVDHEIVNGNVTEAESAGLTGRGADGVASAGALPTTSAKPQRTSNAGSLAFDTPPPLALTGYTRAIGYTRAFPERFGGASRHSGNPFLPRWRGAVGLRGLSEGVTWRSEPRACG